MIKFTLKTQKNTYSLLIIQFKDIYYRFMIIFAFLNLSLLSLSLVIIRFIFNAFFFKDRLLIGQKKLALIILHFYICQTFSYMASSRCRLYQIALQNLERIGSNVTTINFVVGDRISFPVIKRQVLSFVGSLHSNKIMQCGYKCNRKLIQR